MSAAVPRLRALGLPRSSSAAQYERVRLQQALKDFVGGAEISMRLHVERHADLLSHAAELIERYPSQRARGGGGADRAAAQFRLLAAADRTSFDSLRLLRLAIGASSAVEHAESRSAHANTLISPSDELPAPSSRAGSRSGSVGRRSRRGMATISLD